MAKKKVAAKKKKPSKHLSRQKDTRSMNQMIILQDQNTDLLNIVESLQKRLADATEGSGRDGIGKDAFGNPTCCDESAEPTPEAKAAIRERKIKEFGRENAEVTAWKLEMFAKIALAAIVEGSTAEFIEENSAVIAKACMTLGEELAQSMNIRFHELVKIETDNTRRELDAKEAKDAAAAEAKNPETEVDPLADEVTETKDAEKTGEPE